MTDDDWKQPAATYHSFRRSEIAILEMETRILLGSPTGMHMILDDAMAEALARKLLAIVERRKPHA